MILVIFPRKMKVFDTFETKVIKGGGLKKVEIQKMLRMNAGQLKSYISAESFVVSGTLPKRKKKHGGRHKKKKSAARKGKSGKKSGRKRKLSDPSVDAPKAKKVRRETGRKKDEDYIPPNGMLYVFDTLCLYVYIKKIYVIHTHYIQKIYVI